MGTLKKLTAVCLAFALGMGMLAGCSISALKDGGSAGASSPHTEYDSAPYPGSPTSREGADYYYYNPPEYPPDYYRPNTEEYADITEQGFYPTLTRPLSTFAADVDTASYANLRRMIYEGQGIAGIPGNAVRIEEMLNYFDYDYAAPKAGELFGMTSQVANCPWNPDTKLLIMGFATKDIDYSQIAGSNLVFLIDTSGSMSSQDKLPLLQESFKTLIEQLDESDRISIVTYAGQERVVCEGVPGSDKRGLTHAIDNLSAGGSTNGEAGLKMAYKIAQKHFIEGGNNRIIMASDGDLNVGISSTNDLYDYVSKQRETGVYLSVLGFGTGNYKDSKMETLADNGNGAYHYIDCAEEAEKVFGKDLCANLVTLAKDVKLQVEFNSSQVKGYRLIGYENRAMADEDFEVEAADAGEIGWGHQVTVAYELVLPDSKIEIPLPDLKYRDPGSRASESSEWLTCTVRYKAPDTDKSYENRYVVDKTSYTTRPSDDWAFAAAVIEAGMVLRDSDHRGEASLAQAEKLLAGTRIADRYKKEFAALVSQLDDQPYYQKRGTYY